MSETLALVITRFGSGIMGGLALILFLRPNDMTETVKRVVISALAAEFLTPIIRIHFLGIHDNDMSIVASIAFVVGFVSWGLLGMVANYLDANRDRQITKVLNDLVNLRAGNTTEDEKK